MLDKKSLNKSKAVGRRIFIKKKCRFCAEEINTIDYKDIALLQKFISDRGKIIPSRISGNCAKHQRRVAEAIRQARFIALLPFVNK